MCYGLNVPFYTYFYLFLLFLIPCCFLLPSCELPKHLGIIFRVQMWHIYNIFSILLCIVNVCMNIHLYTHACVCDQSCLILCDPLDCSLPGSSIHGIFQARTRQWAAISTSRRSFQPRDQMHISYISCCTGRVFPTVPPGTLCVNSAIKTKQCHSQRNEWT